MTQFVAFHKNQSALPIKGDTIEIQGAPPPDSILCVSNHVKFSSVAGPSQLCPNPPGVGYNGVAVSVSPLPHNGNFHSVLVIASP